MFSKLSLFKITSKTIHFDSLVAAEFVPTTPNQQKSVGFEPPRAAYGAMVEHINGQLIARAVIETRKVPSDALQRRIDEIIDAIKKTTGRKPGRKERAQIKGDAVDELLPQAFPRRIAVPVWINPAAGVLAIGSTSAAQVDDIITAMVRAIEGFTVQCLNTNTKPAAAMAWWIMSTDESYTHLADDLLEVGLACELRSLDESRAVTRYQRQSLDSDDVRNRITKGYAPTSLALVFDGRVAFTLTAALELKGIEFIDGKPDGNDDAFEADVVLATAPLNELIAHMIDALGGIAEQPAEHDKAPPAEAERPGTAPDLDADPLIDRARALVTAPGGKASISYVQRKLEIGYNHAAGLLMTLVVDGTISPMRPDGTHDIINHPKGITQ